MMGGRAADIADSDLAPAAKIEAFIDAFDDMAATRPYMPPMMMREMAEGAVHLDSDTLRLMAAIFANLRAILDEGAAKGVFRPADPVLTYFTLISPIIFFRATAPIRAALGRTHVPDVLRDRSRRLRREREVDRHHRPDRRRARTPTVAAPAPAFPRDSSWRPRMKANALVPAVPVALALALAAGCASKAPADRVRASGSVEATEVQVAPQVGGRLLELKVAEGDRVAVGQTIARLDTTDVELALRRAHGRPRPGATRSSRLLLAGARAEDIRQAEAQVEGRRGRRRRRPRRARRGRGRPRALRGAARVELRLRRSSATTRRRGGTWRRARLQAARGARARRPRGAGAARARRAAGGDRRRARPARRRRRADRHARAERRGRHRRSSPVAGIVTQKLADAGEILAPRAPIVDRRRSRPRVGERLRRRAARAAPPPRPAGDALHRRRRRGPRGHGHLHLAEGRVHAAQRADGRGALEARLPHQGRRWTTARAS